jgi:hypothetical protein
MILVYNKAKQIAPTEHRSFVESGFYRQVLLPDPDQMDSYIFLFLVTKTPDNTLSSIPFYLHDHHNYFIEEW